MCMWVTSDEYIFGSKVGFLKDVGWGCVTNKGIELQIKGYAYSKSGETEVSFPHAPLTLLREGVTGPRGKTCTTYPPFLQNTQLKNLNKTYRVLVYILN